MIKRFLLGAVGFLFGMVEIPVLVVLITGTLLVIGLGSDWFISVGVSAFIGSFGIALGIRQGRDQVLRQLQIEQWQSEAANLPEVLKQLEQDDDAPPQLRAMMQARLREAKEGLARES